METSFHMDFNTDDDDNDYEDEYVAEKNPIYRNICKLLDDCPIG